MVLSAFMTIISQKCVPFASMKAKFVRSQVLNDLVLQAVRNIGYSEEDAAILTRYATSLFPIFTKDPNDNGLVTQPQRIHMLFRHA